jgi:hypothetical protein
MSLTDLPPVSTSLPLYIRANTHTHTQKHTHCHTHTHTHTHTHYMYIYHSHTSQVCKHILPHTKSTSYQAIYHKEVTVPHLLFRTVGKGDDWTPTDFLARSSITLCIEPSPLQSESQVSTHRLPSRTQSSYQVVSHKEVHVRHGEDCIPSGLTARSLGVGRAKLAHGTNCQCGVSHFFF